jgi:hypothetical protein
MKKDFLLREAFQFLFELGPFDSAPLILRLRFSASLAPLILPLIFPHHLHVNPEMPTSLVHAPTRPTIDSQRTRRRSKARVC